MKKSQEQIEKWIKRYFNLTDRKLHKFIHMVSEQQISCSHYFFDSTFIDSLKSFLGVSNIEIATDKDGIMFRWTELEKINIILRRKIRGT